MKTYIWTLPTRLFHWMLAVAFTAAFLLGGEENYLNWHAALGTLIGCLVLFRILQGFIGPRYARFSDFPVSPASLIAFLKDIKQSKAAHAGHNPAAALVMLGIMVAAILSAFSGMMIFAGSETGFMGIKAGLVADQELFEEFHEVIVHVFLALVGVHLTGILADTLLHPANGTVFSIFTGYKKIKAVDAAPTAFHKVFSVFWFVVPLLLFFYVLKSQPVPAGEAQETEQAGEAGEDEED
jgi:cytochrome b